MDKSTQLKQEVLAELDFEPTSDENTDTDIARAATSTLALDWQTTIPKGRVKVKVEDGWVTLEGEVGWNYQRQAAEGAVKYLGGVRGVTNLVMVKPKVATQQLQERIFAFRRSADLDSKVTLFGNVHSWTEREAGRVAWAAPGVSQVGNQITLAA